ncbi:sensor histidine kinase [Ructibacterium gallinarum]|uniref:Histidine kinase n=1 Tax=Ructibacterium gallinarum TaxID=2779355 RepID=A0A9D5M1H5_9FIRM|nr:sensor histidine kinase [Ructibacterium gallinarum]MBE5040560.1 histidine kinase [Ructibacterium gallinarum]
MKKMKFFYNISIKRQLLLSYLLVILFCTSLSYITIYVKLNSISRSQLMDQVNQIMVLASNNIYAQAEYVDTLLFNIQINSSIISTITNRDIDVFDSVNILNDELSKTDILQKKISEVKLYLIDRPEYPSIYSDSLIVSDEMVKNDVWYQKSIEYGGKTFWSVFHTSGTYGYIQASQLIRDFHTKSPIAVATIKIDLTSFLNSINEIQLHNTGDILLLNNTQLVCMFDKSYLDDIKNSTTLVNFLSDNSTQNTIQSYNGQRYILSKTAIRNTEFSVVGIFNLSILNIIGRYMERTIIIISIISILLSLLLMSLMSHSITKPIYNLCTIMKLFKKDTSFRCEVPYTNEIGKLYSSFNVMMSTMDNLITDVNTLFKQQKILELKALQAQINPHFLYNTLDSVNWMAQQSGCDDISHIVTALGSFFRYSLNKGMELTTIENELNQIQYYIEIQKIRFKDKLIVTFDIDNNILKCQIAKLTLQPLVENCIVHGFDKFEYVGIINITGFRKEGYIYITVSDNGRGGDIDRINKLLNKGFIPNEPIEKYGINNVNQRLRLYFSEECGLYYKENDLGGIDVTAKLKERYFTQ